MSLPTREIKRLPFEMKGFAEDGEFFTFEGYASTFGNVDLGDDVIVSGAFTKSLVTNNAIPILWQHQMSEPIGVSVALTEDSKGLYIKAKLPREDSHVQGRVIPQMKVGSIREMSIGYFTKDSEMKEGVRYIKEIELFEVSLVTKAMNPKALVSGFKSFSANYKLPLASRERAWDSTMAEERIRNLTNSTDAPSAEYRKYFMYYDGSAPELFGSYKLLFADVINGEATIVPRAIFAIAGILNGARGGVDITEADKNRIKPVINQIYKRMADEFNDNSIASPLIKSFESITEIEKSLKERGFSNTEAKTLISKIKEFSNQRDAEEKQALRDAAAKQDLAKSLESFLKQLKK